MESIAVVAGEQPRTELLLDLRVWYRMSCPSRAARRHRGAALLSHPRNEQEQFRRVGEQRAFVAAARSDVPGRADRLWKTCADEVENLWNCTGNKKIRSGISSLR
jgi:hypothetical protein